MAYLRRCHLNRALEEVTYADTWENDGTARMMPSGGTLEMPWHGTRVVGFNQNVFLLIYLQSDYVQQNHLKSPRLHSGDFFHIHVHLPRRALPAGRGKHEEVKPESLTHAWQVAGSATVDKCDSASHGVIALLNLHGDLGLPLSSAAASGNPRKPQGWPWSDQEPSTYQAVKESSALNLGLHPFVARFTCLWRLRQWVSFTTVEPTYTFFAQMRTHTFWGWG